MIVTDWLDVATEEIASDPNCCDIQSSSADAMAAVIEKHIPFQRGGLYMLVPRCDGCKFWGDRGEGTRAPCEHPMPKRATGPATFDRGLTWHDPDDGCVQFEAK